MAKVLKHLMTKIICVLSTLKVLTRDELQIKKVKVKVLLRSRIAITYWSSSPIVYKLMAFYSFP